MKGKIVDKCNVILGGEKVEVRLMEILIEVYHSKPYYVYKITGKFKEKKKENSLLHRLRKKYSKERKND